MPATRRTQRAGDVERSRAGVVSVERQHRRVRVSEAEPPSWIAANEVELRNHRRKARFAAIRVRRSTCVEQVGINRDRTSEENVVLGEGRSESVASARPYRYGQQSGRQHQSPDSTLSSPSRHHNPQCVGQRRPTSVRSIRRFSIRRLSGRTDARWVPAGSLHIGGPGRRPSPTRSGCSSPRRDDPRRYVAGSRRSRRHPPGAPPGRVTSFPLLYDCCTDQCAYVFSGTGNTI